MYLCSSYWPDAMINEDDGGGDDDDEMKRV